MLMFVLIAILATPPACLGTTFVAPLGEGREAGVPPKPVLPSDPARRRAIFAGKVETAWILADELPLRSEAEACS